MLITDFNYGIFNFQTVDGHDAIGIGTEMFMGKTALYDQLSIANPNFPIISTTPSIPPTYHQRSCTR
ncbi:MAG: hypothetical protein IPP42_01785 [Saprospiraceae bacterium]|nr:hypothetical protein [Saprospiraceae bacterium]